VTDALAIIEKIVTKSLKLTHIWPSK